MADQRDYLIPVNNLLIELLDYKDTLEQRAINENNTGTFSRIDMSRRGSFMANTDGRNDEPPVNPNDPPAVDCFSAIYNSQRPG